MTKILTVLLACASLLLAAPRPTHAQQTQTKNPHGELKEACASCHSAKGWKPAAVTSAFKHSPKRFPLVGAHSTANCRACHTTLDFKGVSTKCAVCHKDIHRGELGSDCAVCHTPRSFVDRSVMVQAHQTTRFPLTGAHVLADCLSCHPPVAQGHMSFVGRPVECFACHVGAYDATTAPAHKSAGFPTQCEACHTTVEWGSATFDHNNTQFPLTGAHAAVVCASCHASGVYKGLSTACVGCHLEKYNQTTTPAHAPAGFPQDCTVCHNTATWTGATFDHNKTAFALTGAHAAATCTGCHADGVYKGKPVTCVSCHLTNFNATTDPRHSAAAFATTCADCHSTVNFTSSTWKHPTNLFAFTGAHVGLECKACHADNVFKGKGTTCVTCHMAKFNATTAPVHSTLGYGTNCEACHATATWLGAAFNYVLTWPAYTGAHVAQACIACHADNVYKGKPITCVSCHQNNYNLTVDPKHSAAAFAVTCQDCHSTVNFTSSTWKHPTNLFAFTGAHVGLDCKACHADNIFKGKGTTCVTCHLANFNNTTDPKHSAAGFLSANCSTCHSTVNFTSATWTHPTNLFQFTGAHVGLSCNACHGDNIYKGKGTTCVTCHLAKYNATTTPKHSTSGFPTSCADCHTTSTWLGAVFDHNKTLFPLTGSHLAVACAGCHGDGVYKGKPTTCVSCHLADWTKTADPKHSSAGFAQTCQDCHSTTNFTTSTWVHPTTLFQFTGAHVGLKCNACHADNIFKGKGTTCVTCHLTTYNATTNPVHTQAGFSTDCKACHSTATWAGATFNHTWFPVNHHNSTCAQCHTTGIYAKFSCRGCHGNKHNKNYTDAQCYSCHPNGRVP